MWRKSGRRGYTQQWRFKSRLLWATGRNARGTLINQSVVTALKIFVTYDPAVSLPEFYLEEMISDHG